ncbi:nuclease domain-containing protein 1, partial [Orchesella cincta]
MSPPSSLPYNLTAASSSTVVSPTSSSMDPVLINFLKEYRVLECSCCTSVFGFQHKATGTLYCVEGCHERGPQSPPALNSPNLMGARPGSTLVTIPNGIYSGPVVSKSILTSNINGPSPPLTPAPVVSHQVPVSTPSAPAPTPKAPVVTTASIPAPTLKASVVTASTPAPTPKVPVVAPKAAEQQERVQVQGSNAATDVVDSRTKESRSEAKPKSIRVKPDANVESSRAEVPWLDFKKSENVTSTIVFDCGNGGFFFQPCSPDVLKSCSTLRDKIVEVIRSGKCKPVVKPAVGILCLAPFDGDHYRAEVIASEAGGKWKVFFIDYGNTEILNATELLTIPEELKADSRLCAFAYWDKVLASEKTGEELASCCDLETETVRLTFLKRITTGQYVVQIGGPANAIFEVEKSSAPIKAKVPMHQWADCEFSPNLIGEVNVHVVFAWNANTLHVTADADEEKLTEFQQLITEYAAKAERFTNPPDLDEIVIAQYDGAFYRGKVDKVEGDMCTCTFVDYGDTKVSKVCDVIPVNDVIMKYPVYGMIIRLDKVPTQPDGFKFDGQLEDLIYNHGYILDLLQSGKVRPADLPHFYARLWDCDKANTLNDGVKAAVMAFKSCLPYLTAEEEQEISYLLSTDDPFIRGTIELVEAYMHRYRPNDCSSYVLKLDNAEYPYKVADLPLMPLEHLKDVFEVEITRFNSMSNIVGKLTGEVFQQKLRCLNESIALWIKSALWRPQDMHGFVKHPGNDLTDRLCLVKWPKWEEVNYVMECILGKEWWRLNFEDMNLDIFENDYKNHTGKWFRAALKQVYYIEEEPYMYEVFLVDIGRTTLIPAQYVFKIPHRFILDFQMTLFFSIQLDNIIQYSNEVDEKWKYLLLPGMKIKVKVLWMVDEVVVVKLIDPSEQQFDTHFKRPSIQKRVKMWKKKVQDKQRHRKVRGMSTLKGSFNMNMQKVLAQEAKEKKLQLEMNKYSKIGRLNLEVTNPLVEDRNPSKLRIKTRDI